MSTCMFAYIYEISYLFVSFENIFVVVYRLDKSNKGKTLKKMFYKMTILVEQLCE